MFGQATWISAERESTPVNVQILWSDAFHRFVSGNTRLQRVILSSTQARHFKMRHLGYGLKNNPWPVGKLSTLTPRLAAKLSNASF